MKLRKVTIALLMVVALLASFLIIYSLHGIKKFQLVFSGDGLIVDDGGGPYEDGSQGVRVGFTRAGGVFLDLNSSSRLVYIRFEDASWKDERLGDVASPLPSGRYRIMLGIQVSEGSIADIEVGERLEPDIAIILYDGETGGLKGSLVRMLASDRVYIGAWMIVTPPPEPPKALYQDGYFSLVRTDEHTWILQGDAWFTLLQHAEGEPVKHYVRLSFKITIIVETFV